MDRVCIKRVLYRIPLQLVFCLGYTEKVCRWREGFFLRAYEESRTDTAHSVLEGSAIAQALVTFAEDCPDGSVFSPLEMRKGLLEIAKHNALDASEKAFGNDRIFKGVIERLNPALMRCYGFAVQWCRGKNRNEYKLLRVGLTL